MTNRKYKKPPVVEALCEIFFDGSEWDTTLPGLFFAKVKDTYPKKRELEHIGVEVNISKDIQDSRFRRGDKRTQFIKEDGSRLVQIEQDLLVVNQLKPYPQFEDWKPAIDKMLNLYIELAKPKGIRQLGLRYINKINLPLEKFKIRDYFYLYPQAPEIFSEIQTKFMMRLEVPPKSKDHQLVITFASTSPDLPGTLAVMLDLYDIFSAPQLNEIDKYLIESHENIETAFENSITEKARNLFEKE